MHKRERVCAIEEEEGEEAAEWFLKLALPETKRTRAHTHTHTHTQSKQSFFFFSIDSVASDVILLACMQ